ncbi:hypothetical protein EII22_08955 [Coriobacteriales bacterium OH1046]|nr:hypothetical protein EII22_08955 [Coriobacteriales bacterium OH1046]
MNRWYTDLNRKRVSRFRDATAEYFDWSSRSWKPDQELYDVLVGELTLVEITEDEADAIIAGRAGAVDSR